MLSKSSDDKTNYAFSLSFDRKSTHSLVFLSDDNTVMSNAFSKETPVADNSTGLVVDVGVISRKKIDTYYYAGNFGWSFTIHNCLSYICLTAQHLISKTNKPIKIMSLTNTGGTTVTGRLGFFVNMNRNEFSVIDKDTSKILYTLTRVVSTDQLCLAFGVYNAKLVAAKLEILYSYDFTTLPITYVIA
ncbi:unnamed protein product [Mytilus edulis]|uniref:Uncharacterized protein n=1 Tax=Mytilus edulis TaxID=6550 RepID=A0A8S3PYA7_MYTED|nr:unnamed protein product [Mytilus edulis]